MVYVNVKNAHLISNEIQLKMRYFIINTVTYSGIAFISDIKFGYSEITSSSAT